MINFLGCSAQGIAVANGVTTLALLEHMVERKILTRSEVRGSWKRHRMPRTAHQCPGRRGGNPPDARPNATSIRRIVSTWRAGLGCSTSA